MPCCCRESESESEREWECVCPTLLTEPAFFYQAKRTLLMLWTFTWIRWLLVSATMISSSVPRQKPWGELNWPLLGPNWPYLHRICMGVSLPVAARGWWNVPAGPPPPPPPPPVPPPPPPPVPPPPTITGMLCRLSPSNSSESDRQGDVPKTMQIHIKSFHSVHSTQWCLNQITTPISTVSHCTLSFLVLHFLHYYT